MQTTLNWHLYEKERPTKDGDYLVLIGDSIHHYIHVLMYATGRFGGWNCYKIDKKMYNKNRITSVFAWAEIPDINLEEER